MSLHVRFPAPSKVAYGAPCEAKKPELDDLFLTKTI